MSAKIDLKKPLSDGDRAYLESRSRHGDIAANDRKFANKSKAEVSSTTASEQPEATEPSGNDGIVEWINNMNMDQLRDELSIRELETTGKKVELQRRLYESLSENE